MQHCGCEGNRDIVRNLKVHLRADYKKLDTEHPILKMISDRTINKILKKKLRFSWKKVGIRNPVVTTQQYRDDTVDKA